MPPRARSAFGTAVSLPGRTGRISREVVRYWGRERRILRQGLTALVISTLVGMVAGIVLAGMENLLADLRGLLLLVPAAIGMRGAIFGALAARLGTGMMTGQFSRTWERSAFTVQNVEASVLLTLFSSALAAVAARAIGGAFGIETIPVWDLVVISVIGGVLSSAVVLGGVLLLARAADRRGWDMDAIGAPLVTTTGDMVTLPALVIGTFFVRNHTVAAVLGVVLFGIAAAAVVAGIRNPGTTARRIVRESLLVLSYAAVVDVLAGGVLEARLSSFVTSPALLVLIPPFIANCGSLGGILSARLGSELHLGLVTPRAWPEKAAALEGSISALFALVAFSGVGLIAHTAALVFGYASPGLLRMVGIALAAGALALILLFFVAYYAAAATYRFGLDPDNHGIPIVTATMDLFGVGALVLVIVAFGAS